MTKDDILQALRLTAMGRSGHPLQEQLAEKLEKAFAAQCRHEPAPVGGTEIRVEGRDALDPESKLGTPVVATAHRRKKAD